jgi:Tfp pilus assembly protein PilO
VDGLLKNKIATSIVILLMGIGYAVYDYLDFQEVEVNQQQSELKRIGDEIVKNEAEVIKVKDFASNIPAVKQSFREQSLQLEAVLESIPRTFEFNKLLELCNQISLNAGISVLKFRPVVGKANETQSFFSIAAVELSVSGTFMGVMLFMDQMTKLKRLLAFKEVQMIAKRNESPEKKESKAVSLDVSLLLETYSLGET